MYVATITQTTGNTFECVLSLARFSGYIEFLSPSVMTYLAHILS